MSLESFQTLLTSLLAQDDEGLAILIECQVLLQGVGQWGWEGEGRAARNQQQQQETIAAAASAERQTGSTLQRGDSERDATQA